MLSDIMTEMSFFQSVKKIRSMTEKQNNISSEFEIVRTSLHYSFS